MTLRVLPCTMAAARFAVMSYHYSKQMPVGKMVRFGVWENDRFVGAVLFGLGNNQFQGRAWGVSSSEICELTRVALTTHQTPVTRIIAVALRLLRKANPGMRLVFSYADPEQGHHGGIYQGGGWTFVGTGGSHEAFFTKYGKRVHSRFVSASGTKSMWGKTVPSFKVSEMTRKKLAPKWKYVIALDPALREAVIAMAKPFPKRAGSDTKDTAGPQLAKGVSTTTPALHSS